MNDKFKNACDQIEQKCPPIWMMRQAGRYQKGYMQIKENFNFEQMCKLPRIAAQVAMLPIDQFDFDIAILFSDILFPIEGLGVPLKFDPGPKFEWHINEENYKDHSNLKLAIKHMEFQARAVTATREMLNPKKSLIGFVGGPWTLLNYAIGKEAKVSLGLDMDECLILNSSDKLMIRNGLFHSTTCLSKRGLTLLEFENPADKDDIVRYKDKYGRKFKPWLCNII